MNRPKSTTMKKEKKDEDKEDNNHHHQGEIENATKEDKEEDDDDGLYLHHKNQMILDLTSIPTDDSNRGDGDGDGDDDNVDKLIDVYPDQNAKSMMSTTGNDKQKQKQHKKIHDTDDDEDDNDSRRRRIVPPVLIPAQNEDLMIDAIRRSSALRNQNQMILDLTLAADDPSNRDTEESTTEFLRVLPQDKNHHHGGTDEKKVLVSSSLQKSPIVNNDDLLKLPVVSDEKNIYTGIVSAKKKKKKSTGTSTATANPPSSSKKSSKSKGDDSGTTTYNGTTTLPGAYSAAPGVPTVSRYETPDLLDASGTFQVPEEEATDDDTSFSRRRGGGTGDEEDVQESVVTGTTTSPEDTYSAAPTTVNVDEVSPHNTSPPPPPDTDTGAATTTIVEAFRVPATTLEEQEDIEQNIRKRIIQESIQADAVVAEDDKQARSSSNNNNKKWILLGLLLVVAIVIAIVLVGLRDSTRTNGDGNDVNGGTEKTGFDDGLDDMLSGSTLPPTMLDTTPSPSMTTATSTLEKVLKRGKVRCGAYDEAPGMSLKDKDGNYTGFNFQLCRAVAAAVFDNAEQYEIVVVNAANRFQKLASRDLDLISQTVTLTMGRDFSELFTAKGYTFSYPFYFSGIRFGGIPDYVKCADNLDPFTGVCRGLQVCVPAGTTQEAVVRELLPGPKVVPFATALQSLEYMNDGSCNTIAADAVLMNPVGLRQAGLSPNITFELGNNLFSRDPLALVTRDGDTQWSDIVNSIIKIIYTAEAMNITSSNVHTYDFGGEGEIHANLKARITQVVSTIGNYDELSTETDWWDGKFRSDTNGLNRNFNTGLMYSYPFGTIERFPRDTTSLWFLEQIQARGYLVCGINNASVATTSEQGYDSWSMDMEFCRLISAALFVGNTNRVVFKNVTEANGFQELADGSVDVLAGQQMSLSNEFFEPTTGHAYSFSPPYFYHTDGTILGLATRREDELWSSFVYWMTTSVVYAEEHNITSTEAIEMPVVNLFGENYTQSFRDCIAGVGNYGEIYNRTMESILPRSGGNLLNKAPFGPQQVAYPLL